MADRSITVTSGTIARPVWMKQAEEAKLKSEAEKAAAAKAAFDATFKDVDRATLTIKDSSAADDYSSDSEAEEESAERARKNKPAGPIDPSKCTAAGAGIAGGAACAASTFVVVTKDSDGRKIGNGGAELKIRVCPGVGVGGSDQEGIVKDQGDGSYSVTYVVPKRGNYMVHVECNGRAIMGSPFPVFFSAGNAAGGLLGMPPTVTTGGGGGSYPNMVNQTMPNMPNYSGSVSGAFPGLLGMIPGVVPGASGGVILPGVGASLGEICRDYLNGRCGTSECKFVHPPHSLLMTALAATTTMGTLSQVPMAPSAAAMAAAQAIVAAQALQAHAAQVQAQNKSAKDSSGSPDKAGKADALKRTLQISNLSPLLTVEQLKQLFSYCGTVVECSITESKHFAYIEYSKPEEATAALALNNMDVGGRPMNVEMAKSLPPKPAPSNAHLNQSSLPMVMQQAVAMQQMQFQQALLMQQTMNTQQAANRAATMKSATDLAAARAAEISKMLKPLGAGDEKDTETKSRSPSPRARSKSKSPVKYRRNRKSPSYSPPPNRFTRDRRFRSPMRSRKYSNYSGEQRSHRDLRDSHERTGRWEKDRSRDHYSSVSRRNRSRTRSRSPIRKRSPPARSASPKRRRESVSPRRRKSSRNESSKSPKHHRGSRSSPRRTRESTSDYKRRSRSRSMEGKSHLDEKKDRSRLDKLKHDKRKPEKTETNKELDLSTRDSKDAMEDGPSNSSELSPKTLKDWKHDDKRKSDRLEDSDSEKPEATIKEQDLAEDKLMDSSEDEKLVKSPVLTHKKDEASVDDRTHSRSKDLSRYDKSDSAQRRDKADNSRREYDSYEKDRTRLGGDDSRRHGRDYRKHDKVESSRRERDSSDSRIKREDRRTSDSKSKYYKSSSKHPEDTRDAKDRRRSGRSKVEEIEDMKKEVKKFAADDGASGESEDHVSSPGDDEAIVRADRKRREPVNDTTRDLEYNDEPVNDSPARGSQTKAHKRSSMSPEAERSFRIPKGSGDPSRHKKSKHENGGNSASEVSAAGDEGSTIYDDKL